MTPLTAERLREVLNYDPETGVFTWKIANSNRAPKGSVAGGKNGIGYRRIGIDGNSYLEHRLAWLYVKGHWPVDEIDHINGVRDDNRFANLREATHGENLQNVSIRRHNTSGYPGVSFNVRRRKWEASIMVKSVQRTLDMFETAEEAANAYLVAKAELHTFNPTIRNA